MEARLCGKPPVWETYLAGILCGSCRESWVPGPLEATAAPKAALGALEDLKASLLPALYHLPCLSLLLSLAHRGHAQPVWDRLKGGA